MSHSLRSRILVLAGTGVLVAAGALSLLSRQSLLALDRVVRDERARTGAAAGLALAHDLTSDLQTLESVVTAPRSPLPPAVRGLRLADGICRTDAAGRPDQCEPDDLRGRLASPELANAIRDSLATQRPVVSAFVRQPDGRFDAAAVVPPSTPGAGGAAVALIAADSLRTRTQLPAGVTLALAPDGNAAQAVEASVAGTPWSIRVSAASPGDPVGTFRLRSLWLAPSLAVLAILMAWGIVQSVQRPIASLTAAAERITAGDLSAPIVGGTDELGRLGTALELMRRRLEESLEALARANAGLERRVEERTAQLQRLVGKLISAQEDERRRIARELHDETSQVLSALGMALHVRAANGVHADTRELQAMVDRLHDGVHRLIVNLRPSTLDDLGLAAAIGGLADSQLRHAGIQVRCELGDLGDVRFDPAVEIALFRIVQEALLNILRHSGATSVLVQAGLDESGVWIEVEDDGLGFNAAEMQPDDRTLRGIGLLGMRERAELLGGRLTIDSAPGRGTRIRIEAPGEANQVAET
jgi:signal transduction histidine kinase